MTNLKKWHRAKRLAISLWDKAVAYDRMASTPFVTFSDANPYVSALDRARRLEIALAENLNVARFYT